MKNKGFTLIELLSVIVVIAIITLIAFPVISGVVEKSKLKALEDSAYGLIEASNLYYAQYANENTVRFDKKEDVNTLKELSYKGHVDEGTVIINSKGQVTVCITDGKYSAYKNYKDKKITTVAKSICKIPSNSYTVYLGDERTVKTYTNEELTEIVDSLESRIIDKIYPVGSIYMSTTDDTVEKVQSRFGGTWEVYGDGKMIKSSTGTAGSTGGSNSVTLSASNIPSLSVSGTTGSTGSGYSIGYGYSNRTTTVDGAHSHQLKGEKIGASGNVRAIMSGNGTNTYSASVSDGAHSHTYPDYYATSITGVAAHTHTFTGTYTNNSQTKVNVQNEYITVYMYKRVA